MRQENTGKWMLCMLAVLAFAVPSAVGATRYSDAPRSGLEYPTDRSTAMTHPDTDAAMLTPDVGTPLSSCRNLSCQTTAQCRTWCGDNTAWCVPINPELPRGAKLCSIF